MAGDKNTTKPTDNGGAQNNGTPDYSKRKWLKPSDRAKGYADERKAQVHKFGKKNGEPLDDYNKGLRSGYLLCQSDHAGMFRYKQAMEATNDKEYARKFSKEKGTKLNKGGKAA